MGSILKTTGELLGILASFFSVVGPCYTAYRYIREKAKVPARLRREPQLVGARVAAVATTSSVPTPAPAPPTPAAGATSFPYPKFDSPDEATQLSAPATISSYPAPASSPDMPSYDAPSSTPSPALRYPLAAATAGQPDMGPPVMQYPQASHPLPGSSGSRPMLQQAGWRPPYPAIALGAGVGLIFQILAAVTTANSPQLGGIFFGIGLVVAFIVWLMALHQAVRLREWVWLGVMLVGAVLIAFLSLGVLLFSVFGPPDSNTAWERAYAQKRLDQERQTEKI